MSKDDGKHSSGKTSESTKSGPGKHATKPDGFHAGTRHTDPRMHPDGWRADR